jgi:hypothetical protein
MPENKLSIDLKAIEGAFEGEAVKVLKWLNSADVKVTASAPKGIAGLAVLVGAIDKALNDGVGLAENPTSIVLNLGTDVADVKAVWSDSKALLATVGVKA